MNEEEEKKNLNGGKAGLNLKFQQGSETSLEWKKSLRIRSFRAPIFCIHPENVQYKIRICWEQMTEKGMKKERE